MENNEIISPFTIFYLEMTMNENLIIGGLSNLILTQEKMTK